MHNNAARKGLPLKAFTIVLRVDVLRLVELNAVQLAALQQWGQLLPKQDDQVLRRRLHAFGDEAYVQIEVAVVYLIYYGRFDQLAELLDIYDEAGDRVGPALHRHIEVIVMAVPILVRALAEHALVLLLAPVVYPELVGRIETLSSRYVNHDSIASENFRKGTKLCVSSVSAPGLFKGKSASVWPSVALVVLSGAKVITKPY